MKRLLTIFSIAFAFSVFVSGVLAQDEAQATYEFHPSETCRTTGAQCPKPLLQVPLKVFVSKAVLAAMGEKEFTAAVERARIYFFWQTGVDLSWDKSATINASTDVEFEKMPDVFEIGSSLPRGKNALSVFITRPLLPNRTNPEKGQMISTAYEGWIVVSVNPEIFPQTLEHSLLHELGHEFGAADSADADSAMCSYELAQYCAPRSVTFDDRSLADIRGGVKIINRIGLDTYTGLRFGMDPKN